MTPHLILTKTSGQHAMAFLRDRGLAQNAIVHEASARQGPGLVDAAARAPVDLLVLDVATGPGLASAVLRFRLARPDTRVILLAPGRVPGDREVSAIVAAGVMDVVEDLDNLGSAWDRPGDLRAAARWLDPSAVPDPAQAAAAPPERVLERRVAVTQRPAVILVVGLGAGVGTTALSSALAGYLDRQGHRVALLDLATTRGLTHLADVPQAGEDPAGPDFSSTAARTPWTPLIDVFAYTGRAAPDVALRGLVKARRHAYIVCDLGALAATDLALLTEWADLTLVAIPGLEHRLPSLLGPTATRPLAGAPNAVWVAVGGAGLSPDRLRAFGIPTNRFHHLPLPPALDFPPAYRRPFPALDAAAEDLLADVLPDGSRSPQRAAAARYTRQAQRAARDAAGVLGRVAGVFVRTVPVVLGFAAAVLLLAGAAHLARQDVPGLWGWLRSAL